MNIEKINLRIDGMTCQACASRIEKVCHKKEYIVQADVNFANDLAQITFDPSQKTPDDIIKLIETIGFTAHIDTPEQALSSNVQPVHWHLWLLLLITLPFMVGMIGMMIGEHQWMLSPIWQAVLASIVQLWLAIPFYKSGWASLKGGLANMDVLVSLGTLTIYVYSIAALLYPSLGHVYFEASVMVIGFVSLGKFLEERVKKNSLNSLGLLLQLTPKQVTVQRDQQWRTLSIGDIVIGDIIRANQGDRIAADGLVVSGYGWADESHLTGESMPEAKQEHAQVLAGAMMTAGSIMYRAEKIGKETLLGDMMNALAEAQGSKAPIARLADKVAAVFVPVVVSIALITFIGGGLLRGDWLGALVNAVAVLVIACPCALGLATPAAIMVGMGKAVGYGVWFKEAAALEEAAHVDTVVLDKTGTLTQGKPKVVAEWYSPDVVWASKVGHDASAKLSETSTLWQIAATVEQYVTHPLATCITEAAKQKNIAILSAEQVHATVGEGVTAYIEGIGQVKVGSPAFCQWQVPDSFSEQWHISTVVGVAVKGRVIGALALADPLKDDSILAIKRLHQQGISVYMLSGDQPRVVKAVAAQLGLVHAVGQQKPSDKANVIKALKAQGHCVAMVGDGVNDAPALAIANVSFAIKGGTDVAEHTASAMLMRQSVNQMVDALWLAQQTLKNIQQNLFFAFFYNVVGIPLAAFGLLNPVMAGAAMALSSVSVLGNALRLKYKQQRQSQG